MAGETTHYRTCPLCEATCGLELTVRDGAVVRIRGDFLPNPALPPRSIVAIVVTGSDGSVRRFPLARTDMTVSAELGSSGFQDVAIRFELVRFGTEPPPPRELAGEHIDLTVPIRFNLK